jgi:hypothetical protein
MAGINFINEEEYSKPLTFKNNDVIHVVVKSFCDKCNDSGLIEETNEFRTYLCDCKNI